jgi:putative transposase
MTDKRQLNLLLNMLLEWNPIEGKNGDKPVIERVLDFDLITDEVVVIDILNPYAFPALRSNEVIQQAHRGDAVAVRENDPFAQLSIPEEKLSLKQIQQRDAAWQEISLLLEDKTKELLLYSQRRGTLIDAHRIATKRQNKNGTFSTLSKTTVNKRLRRWWQSGRRKNAFLANFSKCGAPGKRRLAKSHKITKQHPKVGRRSALAITTGRTDSGVGVRMTEDIYRKFQLGLNKFYKTPDERSLRQTFDLTLQKYFAVDFEIVNGNPVAVVPPEDERPTLQQFYYWYEHVRNDEKEKRARQGDTQFELKSRQMLGDSRKMGFAPGSLYQIDATILNLYLVSALDRTRIVGRAVLYNCIDVFSSALPGFAIMLEGPSWVGAMLALDNVCMDKVAFCAELGIEITEDEWPCKGLPTALLADRGELEGYNADTLVNAFGMRVHNTGVRRADWKGFVERSFGLADEKVVKFTPGYVPPIGHVRGAPDYALKAVMTLGECRKLMTLYALDYNMNFYLKNYRMNEYMIADHVPRYPLELWNWGIKSRGGRLTQPSQEIIRLNLLPRKRVSVTARGLHFAGDLYYECDTALRENWFVKARNRGQWRIEIAYDPRTTKQIYLPLDNGTKLEVCRRTLASQNLPALDCNDAMDYYAIERAAYQVSETCTLRTSARLQAQKDAIVGEAIEKTQAANAAVGPTSKRARRGGIRQNRAAEKQTERDRTQWGLGTDTSTDMKAVAGSEPVETIIAAEQYIPASSKLTRIGALLDKEWNKNEA